METPLAHALKDLKRAILKMRPCQLLLQAYPSSQQTAHEFNSNPACSVRVLRAISASPPASSLMSRYVLGLWLWAGFALAGLAWAAPVVGDKGSEVAPEVVPRAVPVTGDDDSGEPARGVQIAKDSAALCLTAASDKGLRVLILSDSMGIGGFAGELDACFRACPGVAAVHTIVACGTNPLSWLKAPPYTNASTRCGFIRIETVVGKTKPATESDCYGTPKGHKPGAHTVPKIEDLLERVKPDIVVFQNGNNFFDFFSQGSTIKEETHGNLIRAHVLPLARWLAANASSVKKFYWVGPPQAGNVSPEVQQFVFDSISTGVTKIGVMLDSRKITHYPYKNQDKDKMHFFGQAALDWGDDTFRLIAQDLGANDIEAAQVLTKRSIEFSPPVVQAKEGDVQLRLRLKAVTKVPEPETFAPYGEFLVGYVYDVVKVLDGKYDEKQVLVMHPAYIKHIKQDLTRYKLAKEFDLSLAEIEEDSLWATVHRRDDVSTTELFPFMLTQDIGRHPDSPECGCTEQDNSK